MKIYELRQKALQAPSGEEILGARATGSHACYLIYGVLKPGEKGRVVKPGRGHEEMVLAVSGALEVTGHFTCALAAGAAVHLVGEQECLLENRGAAEAVYVIAGGHSSDGGHH